MINLSNQNFASTAHSFFSEWCPLWDLLEVVPALGSSPSGTRFGISMRWYPLWELHGMLPAWEIHGMVPALELHGMVTAQEFHGMVTAQENDTGSGALNFHGKKHFSFSSILLIITSTLFKKKGTEQEKEQKHKLEYAGVITLSASSTKSIRAKCLFTHVLGKTSTSSSPYPYPESHWLIPAIEYPLSPCPYPESHWLVPAVEDPLLFQNRLPRPNFLSHHHADLSWSVRVK